MKLFKIQREMAERIRLKLGLSHYALYWISFLEGVVFTLLVLWLLS
jgi:hypothetical protein